MNESLAKRKSYPLLLYIVLLLLLLLLSATVAPLSTFGFFLWFSFVGVFLGMRKNKFSFSWSFERARHLIFVLCIKGSCYCCCCCCCHFDCCCCCWCCWRCGPLLAASHFLSGRIFHPVAISLISTLPLYKVITTQATRQPDRLSDRQAGRHCLGGWVYSEMGEMGGWACARQV